MYFTIDDKINPIIYMKLLGQHKNSICNSCTARPAPKKDKLQLDNESKYGLSGFINTGKVPIYEKIHLEVPGLYLDI